MNCSLCDFSAQNHSKLAWDMVPYHRNDSKFIVHCNYPNCFYSTKSWGAYKTHVWRNHKADGSIEDEPVGDNMSDNDDIEDEIEQSVTLNHTYIYIYAYS